MTPQPQSQKLCMTVGELRKRLKDLPPNAEIVVNVHDDNLCQVKRLKAVQDFSDPVLFSEPDLVVFVVE